MRLGVFGGTFDPVHYGHLLLAEQCREQCQLDEVLFIPAGTPPHKLSQTIAPAAARVAMLELATGGHDQFRIDRRELVKVTPSYTVETLEDLQAEDPERELFFLMGADSLRDFPTWRDPGRVLELATLAVVNRGDQPAPDLAPVRDLLKGKGESRVMLVTMPAVEISSSDLRRRVSAGESIRYLTPRAVECYIATHGLYRQS